MVSLEAVSFFQLPTIVKKEKEILDKSINSQNLKNNFNT